MKTWDVDDIIKFYNNRDITGLIQIGAREGLELDDRMELEEIMKAFIRIIEEDNMLTEYIKDKTEISELAKFFTNPRNLKDFIENRDEYEILWLDIPKMVVATNDTEYMKKFLRKKGHFIEYESGIVDIIIGTKDKKLLEYYISKKEEYRIKPTGVAKLIIATR